MQMAPAGTYLEDAFQPTWRGVIDAVTSVTASPQHRGGSVTGGNVRMWELRADEGANVEDDGGV